jgi:hypothetical protein
VSIADFWRRLQTANPIPTVRAFAGINIGLEIDRFEDPIQRDATLRYVRPEHRPLAAPGREHPIPGAFFARASVLTVIKSVIVAANAEPPATTFDAYVVGDIALDANEIAFADPRGASSDISDSDVAVHFIAVWDLYNPRFLGYGLARAFRMIELLQGDDPTVMKLRSRLSFDPLSPSFDGLSLVDFVAVAFGLFAHVRTRAAQRLGDLIGDPAGFTIDAGTFLSDTSLPRPFLDKFLASRSLTLAGFRQEITGGKLWGCDDFIQHAKAKGFATDFRVFRRYPLMDLGNGQHLILDLQFLEELPAAGVFFHLLNQLDNKGRKTLLDLWGRIFELLVIELFQRFYPDSTPLLSSRFRADYPFEGCPEAGVTEGQMDGLLDLGGAVILFEFKHVLLSQDIKDSLDRARLEAELRLKLVEDQDGEPKAVRQLANAAAAFRSGVIKTASGPDAVIYPVVIVADCALEAFTLNSWVNRIFQEYAAGIAGEIRPITLMSIQELEEALAHVHGNAFTWRELLDSRFVRPADKPDARLTEVRLWSVHQTIHDLLIEKGVAAVPNEFRRTQFEGIASQIRSKYSGDQ